MKRKIGNVLMTLAVLMCFAVSAAAQTGACPTTTALQVNPTWVCVVASTDHNATELGQPKLVSYELQFYAPGVTPATGTPTQVVNIGKGTPNAQGAIWLQRSEVGAIPVGQAYKATVTAIGQGGLVSARSPESNPFGRTSAPAAPPTVVVVTSS